MKKETRVVCICNDVTLEEVEKIIHEEKLSDLESIKRRLRVGMGPCGGKYCINLILRMYPRLLGEDVRGKGDLELMVPKNRPPVKPIPMGLFEV